MSGRTNSTIDPAHNNAVTPDRFGDRCAITQLVADLTDL